LEIRPIEDAPVERPTPALLSLVVPLYNEEETIPHLRRRLLEVTPLITSAVEIILVNDGSRDATGAELLRWAGEDSRVRVISLSRNFGHQAAATAGLDYAAGDAVVLMDGDLQDPPELILDMVAEYRRGFDVVYAQRERRLHENWFKRLTAWAFYRIMRFAIYRDLPADTGDFRLISRPCLEAIRTMRETHRFLRGMVAWVGFPQTAVRFTRPARVAGETKYPLGKMLRFAWAGAISFSPLPLRLIFASALIVAAVGFGVGIYALSAKEFGFFVVPGWTSIMLTLCLIGSFILIGLGVASEYLAKIYEEVKSRPLYIVDPNRSRRLNAPAADLRHTSANDSQ
jgi:glycosyltransferase involved in cell wall biosynthesis